MTPPAATPLCQAPIRTETFHRVDPVCEAPRPVCSEPVPTLIEDEASQSSFVILARHCFQEFHRMSPRPAAPVAPQRTSPPAMPSRSGSSNAAVVFAAAVFGGAAGSVARAAAGLARRLLRP